MTEQHWIERADMLADRLAEEQRATQRLIAQNQMLADILRQAVEALRIGTRAVAALHDVITAWPVDALTQHHSEQLIDQFRAAIEHATPDDIARARRQRDTDF